ncbi:MAG: STAS domain-containing protein [Deltaproteobacteria bacterium]|nr:STAS domain-containing protein [Deltaproteobacteria bacterium]
MSEKIDLQFSESGRWLIVRFKGMINLLVRDQLRQAVMLELEKRPTCDLVIDLSGVTAVDSSGLGAIFSIYKYLSERQSTLALAAPNRDVGALLELTHLDKVIRIEKLLATITG